MANILPKSLSQLQDIALDPSGDLIVDETGDIATVTGLDAFQQEILFRLKTHIGDYWLQPLCGASLDTLIGLPLSDNTGSIAESLIINALTHDGLLTTNNITVNSYPQNATTLGIIISINLASIFTADDFSNTGSILSMNISVDLQSGLLI
jgi:phage baseplate assembly protein W